MLLFAGFPVPEPAQSELGELLNVLQQDQWPVRWARPGGLHLTIKYFGTVAESDVPPIETALQNAADGFGPVPLAVTGLGSFPAGRRARVIWAGLDAPASLELFQDRIERVSEPLGFPPEGRPFRPHITLGRVIEGKQLPPSAALKLDVSLDIQFLADRLVLFESAQARDGSVYTPRQAIELSSCPAA